MKNIKTGEVKRFLLEVVTDVFFFLVFFTATYNLGLYICSVRSADTEVIMPRQSPQ